jgi:hypothetical protein
MSLGRPAVSTVNDPELERRVEHLESEVAQLRDSLKRIAESLGESDLMRAID